jgi:hypothetical protein
MNPYLEVLRKYAVFKGRARRSEYWGFWLINGLVARHEKRPPGPEEITDALK